MKRKKHKKAGKDKKQNKLLSDLSEKVQGLEKALDDKGHQVALENLPGEEREPPFATDVGAISYMKLTFGFPEDRKAELTYVPSEDIERFSLLEGVTVQTIAEQLRGIGFEGPMPNDKKKLLTYFFNHIKQAEKEKPIASSSSKKEKADKKTKKAKKEKKSGKKDKKSDKKSKKDKKK